MGNRKGAVQLTKRVVDGLKPALDDLGQHQAAFLWDAEVPGFGVRVTPAGVKAFVLQYTTKEGRKRRLTIDKVGKLVVKDARDAAKELLREVRGGKDPASTKKEARQAPTVAEVCKRFLAAYPSLGKRGKKPRTVAEARRILETKIIPTVGAIRMASLTRRDVLDLQAKYGEAKIQCNRLLAVLSRVCTWAEGQEYRPVGSNPCKGVDRFAEHKRSRLLSAQELARLGAALTTLESSSPAAARLFRLLVLTGCRLREVMFLDWSAVDLEAGCIRLPESKTGPRAVLLNAPAVAVLAAVPKAKRKGPVIPGDRPGHAMVNPYRPWVKLCELAKLDGVVIHDLRHAFASSGAAAGDGLSIIASLLGQSQLATTERYTHLAADPVRDASERIGARLWAALTAPVEKEEGGDQTAQDEGGNVVAMKPRG